MPIDILQYAFLEGTSSIPAWGYMRKYAPAIAALASAKYYFRGTMNTWERDMHGQVYILTGGTSGAGSWLCHELALRGAHVILLVRVLDGWVSDYIERMRSSSNNELIYAEECDLLLLHAIRLFATRWLDSSPPRRLDGVICCAGHCAPPGVEIVKSVDGIEAQMGVNYLANFHLLTLLSPSLRAQPPDRDVRVVIAGCALALLGVIDEQDLLWTKKPYLQNQPWRLYGTSKLLLAMFAREFQNQLMEHKRPDGAPCNVRVHVAVPGMMRTLLMRNFLTRGTVWGLILYVMLWPLMWLLLKSARMGAQTLMYAVLAPGLRSSPGGQVYRECADLLVEWPQMDDKELIGRIYKATEEAIDQLERQSAVERNKETKSTKKSSIKTKQKTEEERRRDIYAKPETEEELQEKLDVLRRTIGVAAPKSDAGPRKRRA